MELYLQWFILIFILYETFEIPRILQRIRFSYTETNGIKKREVETRPIEENEIIYLTNQPLTPKEKVVVLKSFDVQVEHVFYITNKKRFPFYKKEEDKIVCKTSEEAIVRNDNFFKLLESIPKIIGSSPLLRWDRVPIRKMGMRDHYRHIPPHDYQYQVMFDNFINRIIGQESYDWILGGPIIDGSPLFFIEEPIINEYETDYSYEEFSELLSVQFDRRHVIERSSVFDDFVDMGLLSHHKIKVLEKSVQYECGLLPFVVIKITIEVVDEGISVEYIDCGNVARLSSNVFSRNASKTLKGWLPDRGSVLK